MDQLDQTLSGPAAGRRGHDLPAAICNQPQPGNDRLKGFLPTIQVVWSDGTICSPPDTTSPVVVTTGDLAITRGERGATYRDGIAKDGTPMRVFTRPERPGIAVSIARPLIPVNNSLNSLATLLVALTAVAVVGAATTGLLIARAGLRPVDRLTDAVEHIARTEDLDTAIPTEGNDKIARLSTSFNSMTRALASSRDRQQQLIVDAGHELRTPLTSLRTNVDLMLRSETTGRPLPAGDKQKLLVNVKAQLLELTSLTGDLLDLSPAETTSGSSVHDDVALHDLAQNAVRRARLRGPGFHVDAVAEPWYVRGHAASLERAVVNLLDNAVKFSPPDGTITVRLRGGVLTVRDSGPGIPSEDLPYVFDRFWRSPSARGLPGSGLGLAIVARAVREAGGEVRLGPADGGGTLAWLRLPGSEALPEDAEPADHEPRGGVAEAGIRASGEDGGRRD